MQVEVKNKASKEERDRLEAARKDFDKFMKEIAPFIKKKKLEAYRQIGEWRTSEIEEQQ